MHNNTSFENMVRASSLILTQSSNHVPLSRIRLAEEPGRSSFAGSAQGLNALPLRCSIKSYNVPESLRQAVVSVPGFQLSAA